MGLDVSTYGETVLVDTLPNSDAWYDSVWYDNDEDNYTYIEPFYATVTPKWRFGNRVGSLKSGGVYRIDGNYKEIHVFVGEHKLFREELAQLALGKPITDTYWSPNRVDFQEAPFYGLIDFTDGDGIIGTEICKMLAKDFNDYQDKANTQETWFVELYNKWKRIFEIAADKGLVRFY